MATIQDIKNAQPGKLKLIDIRKSPDEQQIPGSIRADGAELEAMVDLPFSKDEHVVLYCGSGNSCSRVAQTLRSKGYTNAEALEGGYSAWKDAGLPTEPRP
ncbi:MAG TPA: rhodanese-like domain-containing protein [Candidatus Rubrimentiphilum sp.]|nr:rhodanese-like domain-containing protein [Candidatus Rubrimentiphilum sp.]